MGQHHWKDNKPGTADPAQATALLRLFEPMVVAMARAMGPHCEVVLQSLVGDLAHSIVRIENGHVTGRSAGGPITDVGMQTFSQAAGADGDLVGPYYSRTRDGKTLKSFKALVRDLAGHPIGMVCINIDISAPIMDVAAEYLADRDAVATPAAEHYALNADELVADACAAAAREVDAKRGVAANGRGKEIVFELCRRGIFEVKGAVELVAREIGVSRYTVYNYLREARVRRE